MISTTARRAPAGLRAALGESEAVGHGRHEYANPHLFLDDADMARGEITHGSSCVAIFRAADWLRAHGS